MSPPLKWMSQKARMFGKQAKWIMSVIAMGLVVSVVIYTTELSNACTVRQINIVADEKTYDKTKDPQLCDSLNSKIYQLNNDCKSSVEELDCG